MFNSYKHNGFNVPLYYHKTSGGAEYLTDNYILTPKRTKEGTFENSNIIIRIDGEELEIVLQNI